jgi:F-type H+-transporting ATPase subunit b
MRRLLLACCLLGLVSVASLPFARAAGPGDHSKKAPKYKHQKDEYDLSDPERKRQLMVDLEAGKIHDLKQKREAENSFLEQMADQAVWTLLVFGALLFILWKYAWAPISAGLHDREHTIEKAFEEARVAREEADKLKAELAGERAKAADEVRRMMDDARARAEQLEADIKARGKAEVQAERDRLHRDLAREHEQAKHQVREEAVGLATLISAKVVRRQLNYDDQRELVAEALAEFRQAGQQRKQNIESMRA